MKKFLSIHLKEFLFIFFLFLVVVAVVVVLAIGFKEAWTAHGIGSSEAAGWAQAIGTVVAIAIAILLGMWQQYKQEIKDSDAVEKYQKDMTLLFYLYARDFCDTLWQTKITLNWEQPGIRFAINERPFEEFRTQFKELPVHTFDRDLMSHVLAFRSIVNEVQQKFTQSVSTQDQAEIPRDIIFRDRQSWIEERWNRAHAIKISINSKIQNGHWQDPDGVYAAMPEPFRNKGK